MKNRMNALPFILLSVVINTLAQLLLKQGASRLAHVSLSWPQLPHLLWQISVNPYIVSGLICYVASVASWLVVLARSDVSFAYPLTSLGYVFTALAGYWFFHESLGASRLIGIGVILIGVYLITKS